MNEETIEELRELGMQILITTLMAVSSVLVQSAINKIRHGHVTNYPSRNNPRRRDTYDEDFGDNDFFINFPDE